MRKLTLAFAAAAALLAPAFGAQAQSAKTNPLAALRAGEVQSQYTQWAPGYRYGPRGYYGPRAYYGRPYGYYGPRYYGRPYGYYRRDNGAAAAAGIVGLATGAIIGGAIANQQRAAPVYQGNSTAAYCAQRYRSYDPSSGTYLGYDGLRHPCP